MSRHREAELKALLSAVRNDEFRKRGITLINYEDLINERGLESMKSPVESGY